MAATVAQPPDIPSDPAAALAAVMARMDTLSGQMAKLTAALQDNAVDGFAISAAYAAGRASERETILGAHPASRKRTARASHLTVAG